MELPVSVYDPSTSWNLVSSIFKSLSPISSLTTSFQQLPYQTNPVPLCFIPFDIDVFYSTSEPFSLSRQPLVSFCVYTLQTQADLTKWLTSVSGVAEPLVVIPVSNSKKMPKIERKQLKKVIDSLKNDYRIITDARISIIDHQNDHSQSLGSTLTSLFANSLSFRLNKLYSIWNLYTNQVVNENLSPMSLFRSSSALSSTLNNFGLRWKSMEVWSENLEFVTKNSLFDRISTFVNLNIDFTSFSAINYTNRIEFLTSKVEQKSVLASRLSVIRVALSMGFNLLNGSDCDQNLIDSFSQFLTYIIDSLPFLLCMSSQEKFVFSILWIVFTILELHFRFNSIKAVFTENFLKTQLKLNTIGRDLTGLVLLLIGKDVKNLNLYFNINVMFKKVEKCFSGDFGEYFAEFIQKFADNFEFLKSGYFDFQDDVGTLFNQFFNHFIHEVANKASNNSKLFYFYQCHQSKENLLTLIERFAVDKFYTICSYLFSILFNKFTLSAKEFEHLVPYLFKLRCSLSCISQPRLDDESSVVFPLTSSLLPVNEVSVDNNFIFVKVCSASVHPFISHVFSNFVCAFTLTVYVNDNEIPLMITNSMEKVTDYFLLKFDLSFLSIPSHRSTCSTKSLMFKFSSVGFILHFNTPLKFSSINHSIVEISAEQPCCVLIVDTVSPLKINLTTRKKLFDSKLILKFPSSLDQQEVILHDVKCNMLDFTFKNTNGCSEIFFGSALDVGSFEVLLLVKCKKDISGPIYIDFAYFQSVCDSKQSFFPFELSILPIIPFSVSSFFKEVPNNRTGLLVEIQSKIPIPVNLRDVSIFDNHRRIHLISDCIWLHERDNVLSKFHLFDEQLISRKDMFLQLDYTPKCDFPEFVMTSSFSLNDSLEHRTAGQMSYSSQCQRGKVFVVKFETESKFCLNVRLNSHWRSLDANLIDDFEITENSLPLLPVSSGLIPLPRFYLKVEGSDSLEVEGSGDLVLVNES
ncbi:hypothetical protein P9112_004227 [Eukaryota sp. TZLM1-RC]